MPAKIVDVFLKDDLVRTYVLDWGLLNSPLFDQDFIDRAKVRMASDGYSQDEIAIARFSIRDVPG